MAFETSTCYHRKPLAFNKTLQATFTASMLNKWENPGHILTLDTTVINACAMRNGNVSGAPYSKQSFMRERPFFPQNKQT